MNTVRMMALESVKDLRKGGCEIKIEAINIFNLNETLRHQLHTHKSMCNVLVSMFVYVCACALPVGESVRLLVDRRPRRVRKRSLTFLASSSSSRFFCRSSSESCSSGSGSFTRSITLPVLSEKDNMKDDTCDTQMHTDP